MNCIKHGPGPDCTPLHVTKALPSFEEACLAFYDVAEKWAEFGAADTEPRSEFAQIVADLADGRKVTVPTTVRGWQLFSGMPGADEAAKALTEAAQAAVEAGEADPFGVMRIAQANGWTWF